MSEHAFAITDHFLTKPLVALAQVLYRLSFVFDIAYHLSSCWEWSVEIKLYVQVADS